MSLATDFLDEDMPIAGQAFALLSFVAPDGTRQKGDRFAVKVRGCFATQDEAGAYAKKLMKFDPSFDVFVAPVGKWLPAPPDPNAVENQEYQEQFLNDLIKGYKESQLEAKAHFAERKRIAMEKGLEAVLTAEERLPPPPDAASGSGSGSEIFDAPPTHPAEAATAADPTADPTADPKGKAPA